MITKKLIYMFRWNDKITSVIISCENMRLFCLETEMTPDVTGKLVLNDVRINQSMLIPNDEIVTLQKF